MAQQVLHFLQLLHPTPKSLCSRPKSQLPGNAHAKRQQVVPVLHIGVTNWVPSFWHQPSQLLWVLGNEPAEGRSLRVFYFQTNIFKQIFNDLNINSIQLKMWELSVTFGYVHTYVCFNGCRCLTCLSHVWMHPSLFWLEYFHKLFQRKPNIHIGWVTACLKTFFAFLSHWIDGWLDYKIMISKLQVQKQLSYNFKTTALILPITYFFNNITGVNLMLSFVDELCLLNVYF